MITDTHKFNDVRVHEACAKAFVQKLREHPKMRKELGIPDLPINASIRLNRFLVVTVEADETNLTGAILGFNFEGTVENQPVLGTASAKLTGLTNSLIDWKKAGNEHRGYIFGLKFKAEILSYQPIKYAKALES